MSLSTEQARTTPAPACRLPVLPACLGMQACLLLDPAGACPFIFGYKYLLTGLQPFSVPESLQKAAKRTMLASAQALRSLAVRGGVRVQLKFQCRAMVGPHNCFGRFDTPSAPQSKVSCLRVSSTELWGCRPELVPRPVSSCCLTHTSRTFWRSGDPTEMAIWQQHGRR